MNLQALAAMDPGDMSDLSCVPVAGVKVSDYDCCATEAWVVVGPALDGEPVLIVETIEARHTYWSDLEWLAEDSVVVATAADAVAAVDALASDYWIGRRCTCP